jgi:hypothetical protein
MTMIQGADTMTQRQVHKPHKPPEDQGGDNTRSRTGPQHRDSGKYNDNSARMRTAASMTMAPPHEAKDGDGDENNTMTTTTQGGEWGWHHHTKTGMGTAPLDCQR